MNIGQKIRARRIELGWSLRELSDRMGYANHSTVQRIEKGTVDIPQSKIEKFSEVLHVSVAYLMGWDEKIEKAPEKVAERHFEILMDEDFISMFEDFHNLDDKKKKIVKDLVRSLADAEV